MALRPAGPARRWRPARAAALLLAALVLTAAACGGNGGGDGAPPAPRARTAPPDHAGDRVGTLSVGSAQGPRECTASVVHSPGRNLLVTAAHCVVPDPPDPLEDLVFTPGYRNGASPYGSWPVSAMTVDPRWTEDADPEYDVAFLTVPPVGGRRIEDVVGANALAGAGGAGQAVSVTGYPNRGEEPITCSGRTSALSPTQQRFDCDGFVNGTSGSPWVTGAGEVVGVIGGYQEGGDTALTSYSITFDDRVTALYRQATAAPEAGGPGTGEVTGNTKAPRSTGGPSL
ncbi:trypsin-like serine peptidase [Kitasatospora sp. NPDC057223]|uniref:trypsin-like serine peptidase n=1 Tax=Kitasatospora sp. NPDC057223 TaxID=3346055 RepID=UPI00363153E2